MNRVILSGRLTDDPRVNEAITNAKYSLAVDRPVSSVDAEKNTDFINCACFGKQVEFAQKHLHKGMKIIVEGRIQTGSYTNKEGQKIYTTDVIVDRHEFCESKKVEVTKMEEITKSDFMSIPDGMEELPFV